MNPAPPVPMSVDHFAELVARLTAPFAIREAVFRDAGLDEHTWTRLEAEWTARLAADGALVDRYIARYAAVTQAPSTSPVEEAPPVAATAAVVSPPAAPQMPSPERPGLVAMPPSALRLDGTLEPDDAAALRAALPFVKGRPAALFTAPSPPKPPADPGRPDATLELGASLPLPLAAPGKRLHRFDSKTGAPLPVPVWTEGPADPKKLA